MTKKLERIKMARPAEPEAVRTTIVGGRPPGGSKSVADVPRGVEVLVKKASVDPKFKKLLLETRAAAAEAIALVLEPAEAAMLDAVPEAQLEAIVANTKVSPKLRPAFLGYAAGVMLAALGAAAYAEDSAESEMRTTGVDAETPPEAETAATAEIDTSTEYGSVNGLVTDTRGNPIKGALVFVRGATLSLVTTNVDGYFKITRVPEGAYEITASRAGYDGQSLEAVKVINGFRTNLSFVLTGGPSERLRLITRGISAEVAKIIEGIESNAGEEKPLRAKP